MKVKKVIEMKKLIPLVLIAAGLCAAATGCATKTRNVELDGMFAQADSATLAIGSVDVMAAPVGEESAIIKYEEDTALLNPETKTHAIRIQLTGSNCVEKVDAIVERICRAFIPTAAIVNGAKVSATNMTHSASK